MNRLSDWGKRCFHPFPKQRACLQASKKERSSPLFDAQKKKWNFHAKRTYTYRGLDAQAGLVAQYKPWNHVEAQIWRPRRSGMLRKKGAYNLVADQSQSHFHPPRTASSVRSRMERLKLWMRVPVFDWNTPLRQVNWKLMKHVFKLLHMTADISLFTTVTTYTQKIFFMFLPSLYCGVLYLNYKHFSCLKLSRDDRRKCFICLRLSDRSFLICYYSFGEHDWGLIEVYVIPFLITELPFLYFFKYVQIQRRCNETL